MADHKTASPFGPWVFTRPADPEAAEKAAEVSGLHVVNGAAHVLRPWA